MWTVLSSLLSHSSLPPLPPKCSWLDASASTAIKLNTFIILFSYYNPDKIVTVLNCIASSSIILVITLVTGKLASKILFLFKFAISVTSWLTASGVYNWTIDWNNYTWIRRLLTVTRRAYFIIGTNTIITPNNCSLLHFICLHSPEDFSYCVRRL